MQFDLRRAKALFSISLKGIGMGNDLTTSAISDYGIIGNTRAAALISNKGSLDWCCFPRFDSPSFFGKLLDPNAGHFQICPEQEFYSEQHYLEDTNILETIFTTKTGQVKIIDFFSVDTEKNKRKELFPYHEILRIVEGLSGFVKMNYTYQPGPGYAKNPYRLKDLGKLGLRCEFGHELVTLIHNLETKEKYFEIKEGEKKVFSLSYNDTAPGIFPPLNSALERLQGTINYWRGWLSQCRYQGQYKKDVRRSALVLKLLTFSPSGAIIAAPTTSLPEEIEGERNWDYRYCWLRDAAFAVRSFLDLGFHEEVHAYMGWILHSTALTRPRLKVLYNVYGESRLPERKMDWLKGYKNSLPVRVGNGADSQFQLDVYGEVMEAVYLYSDYVERFDKDTISFLQGIADSVTELWENRDEGIWEIRSGRFFHTHSKAMAGLALDRFCKLIQKFKWEIPLENYSETYELIKKEIEDRGYNESLHTYTRCYDDHHLDASLLRLPILMDGLDQKRLEETTMLILEQLVDQGLTYRYLDIKDGLKGTEGAFCACSFWLIECLSTIGKKDIAHKLMQDLLKKNNQLGLWPEEMDSQSNEFLGNYPQAFSHTALISAALSLEEGLL